MDREGDFVVFSPTQFKIYQNSAIRKLRKGIVLGVCFYPDDDGTYGLGRDELPSAAVFEDSLIRLTVTGDEPLVEAPVDLHRAEFVVPLVVPMGSEMVIQVRPDVTSPRVTTHGDWVGLYRRGECAEGNPEFDNHWKRRFKSPNDGIPLSEYQGYPSTVQQAWVVAAEHSPGGKFSDRRPFDYNPDMPTEANSFPHAENTQHLCFISWEFMPANPGTDLHTFRFSFNDYHIAGQYDVRYFYGDEEHGGGYRCGLRSETDGGVDKQCLLVARGTSSAINVVPAAAHGTGFDPALPGLETHCDGAYGASCAGGP
jgi:hypothetical protein